MRLCTCKRIHRVGLLPEFKYNQVHFGCTSPLTLFPSKMSFCTNVARTKQKNNVTMSNVNSVIISLNRIVYLLSYIKAYGCPLEVIVESSTQASKVMSGTIRQEESSRASPSGSTGEEELRKRRRAENVRRCREKSQAQHKSIREKYSANEQKIRDLEKTAAQLQQELSASSDPKGKKKTNVNNSGTSIGSSKTRPDWFGEPF